MNNIIRTICGGAAVLLLACGCVFNSKEVTVASNNSLSSQREYFRNEIYSIDGLSLESENFLRGNLMHDDSGSDPQMILRKLDEFYKISNNPKYLLIAADFCRCLAMKEPPAKALKYHLANFYYSTTFGRNAINSSTDEKFKLNLALAQVSQNYNEACCGIFRFLKARQLYNSDSAAMIDAEERKFILMKPKFILSVPPENIEEFSLCAAYSVSNLRQINRRPGLGVPLAAKLKEEQQYQSLKTPRNMIIPVTLLLERVQLESGDIGIRPILIDTGMQEDFHHENQGFKGLNMTLALDFSTPLACYLDGLSQRNLLGQMLNPFEQEASDGLYMVEPFQPGKIPVVFIHGLMSSPETWVQMINSLKNDPTIRQRYQFWFFSYSTGAPVMLSALKLHKALLAAQKELCAKYPETEANFNKMVLVGHSMGGMLTRQMLQKDSHYMMEQLLKTPWAQIKSQLTADEFKLVETISMPALPFVHRAIFMASPHRGADMAQSLIARFGARIIKLPASLLSREGILRRIMWKLNKSNAMADLKNRFYTGIDNLDPKNPFVIAHGNSPMKDDLIYHCIIGNIREDNIPGNSDGVVPYWSSHLDGAASELVVKSNHSVHRQPAAIQEVLRILLLHLKSVDKQ